MTPSSSYSNIVEIAAAVSDKACHVFPTFSRVDRVLDDGRTIEVVVDIGAGPIGNDIDRFWPEVCAISDERKQLMFWQYHRSINCDQYVTALAKVLKDLCDDGVRLVHDGKEVVDILVLNTTEFDVSDLLSVREKNHGVLHVRDVMTDVTLPIIATYEAQDRIIDLGEAFCSRLGWQLPPVDDEVSKILKRHRPESYAGAVPHWWIAVVVEGGVAGNKTYDMVHLDMCGAAYNEKAFVEAPGGRIVSLETFITPEYVMTPNSDKRLKHKLVMKATTSSRCHSRVTLQPKSIRHFRCYHKHDTSSIEVTPLDAFLERNGFSDEKSAKINEMVLSIKQDIILKLPVASEVVVCNIKSKPKLNGCLGTVYKSSKEKVASDRIPVLIKGQKAPIQLKATCIRLPVVVKRQYETLEKKIIEYNQLMEKNKDYNETKNTKLSRKQKSQIDNAFNDPKVIKVLSVMQTGQMTFTCFGDAEFKKGAEKFLRPPLDAILPKPAQENIRNGLELSNHPKANDAIKLIKLMKESKQRMAEHPDGKKSLMRIQMSVVEKIRSDEALSFVFERLDELGFYVNPAKYYTSLGL